MRIAMDYAKHVNEGGCMWPDSEGHPCSRQANHMGPHDPTIGAYFPLSPKTQPRYANERSMA